MKNELLPMECSYGMQLMNVKKRQVSRYACADLPLQVEYIWDISVGRVTRLGSGRPINLGSIPNRDKRHFIVYRKDRGKDIIDGKTRKKT
jgi:hypothetical protein